MDEEYKPFNKQDLYFWRREPKSDSLLLVGDWAQDVLLWSSMARMNDGETDFCESTLHQISDRISASLH